MVSLRTGESCVARARQRSVSMPMPQSRILPRIFSRTGAVNGTLVVPTRTWVQRSITLSGAPWGAEEGVGVNQEDEHLLPALKAVREGGREGTKFGQRERKSFPKSSTQNLALQLSALDGSLRPSTQHQVPRQQDLLCRGSRKTYVSSRDALTPQTPSQSGMRPGLKSLLTKQHLCCLQNA